MECAESFDSFHASQLQTWPEAAARYEALSDVVTRRLHIDGVEYVLQHNPARAVSTSAAVDPQSIARRPCFLCAGNRPECQRHQQLLDGKYHLLVNPFPIFPRHFTIPAACHVPQAIQGRLADMLVVASAMRDYVVFYNGPRAGASAPDHLHFQAVPAGFLPHLDIPVFKLPYKAYRIVSSSMSEAVEKTETLLDSLLDGGVAEACFHEPSVNIYALVRENCFEITVVPRKAHRPRCYYTAEGGYLVSPGAVDIAGVVILPRKDDFQRISADDLKGILGEVAFSNDQLPIET